ncbi:MAG TPA: hypothetical protein V6D19_05445 [Stenomitos sp.]
MTIERNGHKFLSGEELGYPNVVVFEKHEEQTLIDGAIPWAETARAFPVPECFEEAGMSQRLWLVGQAINAAANTIGMGATTQDIAIKAIAIADCIFITLAKDGQV